MLPAVVDYFYEVEAAFSSDSNTANFGFDGQQVSVEEIMVSFLCLTAFQKYLGKSAESQEQDQVIQAIRTLLNDKEGEKYCLQGRFTVSEASTALDWNDVKVTLVNGHKNKEKED